MSHSVSHSSELTWECESFCVRKTVLSSGEWGPRPLPLLAKCRVSVSHIKRSEKLEQPSDFLDHSDLEQAGENSFTVVTGDAACEVDRALERALCSMLVGEQSCVTLESPDLRLQCHIHLHELHNADPLPDWSSSLTLEVAGKYKQRGVELFQQGRTVDAFRHFGQALRVISLSEFSSEPTLAVTLSTNMAACQLQKGNHAHAAALCDHALALQPRHPKALYRRGLAALHLGDFLEAERKAKAVLAIEPRNPQAADLLAQARQHTDNTQATYETMVRRMFQ